MGQVSDSSEKSVAMLDERVTRLATQVAEMRLALEKVAKVGAEENLLTSKQIAPRLGVTHPKTIERWVRERGLPCVRNGRNLRFRTGDVLRWLAQQES